MINSNFRNIIIEDKNYKLAKTWSVVFSGLFDLCFSSAITIIISLIFHHLHIESTLLLSLLIVLSFIIMIIYYLIIPYFCKTKTLGRLIFRIKLYCKNGIKFKHLLIREAFIIFIPWFIGIFTNLFLLVYFHVDINSIFIEPTSKEQSISLFIFRFTSTIYSIWYLILLVGLLIDKNNQLFYDYKLKIYMLTKVSEEKQSKDKENELITQKEKHIHLGNNQPGNIDDKALKDIDKLEDI